MSTDHVLAIAGVIVFAAALFASASVFAFTLFPALPRIFALLRGEADPALPPKITLRRK